jgi:hypothetical protein
MRSKPNTTKILFQYLSKEAHGQAPSNYALKQGDQKVSVHLMITIQKVATNVQSVPRQSPDIY